VKLHKLHQNLNHANEKTKCENQTKQNSRRMTMRKSISILLVMVVLTVIGCASGDAGNSAEPVNNNSDSDRQKALDALKSSKAKTDKIEAERQKAIQWIKSEAKDPELVKSFTEYMDRAIINDVRFEMAFGRKVLKSGKYTYFSWEKEGFSIRTISKEEANSMGLGDERIMQRTLN
jgi:hypothetical protein